MNLATVRQAAPADVAAIRALQEQWEREDVTTGFLAAEPDDISERLGPYLLVAQSAGEIVGFVAASERVSEGLAVIPEGQRYVEIDDLYVAPGCRRTGIGARLVAAVIEQARRNGVERFLIYSASKDVDAMLAFYRAQGFKPWFIEMYREGMP